MRYPNKKEIDSCYEHLAEEIQELSPKIVFLLGGKVSSAVEKHLKINFEKWDEFKYHYKKINGVYYVPIHHPSYIYVYRRKRRTGSAFTGNTIKGKSVAGCYCISGVSI